MKKLLFILLFIPVILQAQNVVVHTGSITSANIDTINSSGELTDTQEMAKITKLGFTT